MSVKRIVFVATDGKLDELARTSIKLAVVRYGQDNPDIFLVSLDTKVPDSDPLFDEVSLDKIKRITITEQDLISYFPNVMTKEFLSQDGEMISHWNHAKSKNQHLAEFSDLAIFYLMKNDPSMDFLYMDSDMLTMTPLRCEKSFVAAYDEGENGSLYINSSLLFVPQGFENVKMRWITMLENEILDKYHFRYGMPGPVAFDKFLNRPEDVRGFKLTKLQKDEVNPIHYREMYNSAVKAIEKDRPILIDIEHKGPLLNIPRSAVTTALTHEGALSLELLLGVTKNGEGTLLTSINFFPKNIRGIEYYEKLKSNLECNFCDWSGTKEECKSNGNCPECSSPSTSKNEKKN